jgi:hypothetical protein
MEVLIGADARDEVTSLTHRWKPVVYRNFANKTTLTGKRLGVVRDFMIEATIADRDSIRIANAALADLKRLGARLVDPVDFHAAIAEVMAAYEPSFFSQVFPEAIPAGTQPVDSLVRFASDPKALAGGVRGVNLRMIAGQRRG